MEKSQFRNFKILNVYKKKLKKKKASSKTFIAIALITTCTFFSS